MPRSASPRTSVTLHGIAFGGAEPPVPYEGGPNYDGTIPAGAVNFEISFPCTVANSVVQAIEANGNCTVKTNDITTPGQTITLVKNKGRVWKSDDPTTAKIFTANVTKLYVTNPGAEDITFKAACGDDITP